MHTDTNRGGITRGARSGWRGAVMLLVALMLLGGAAGAVGAAGAMQDDGNLFSAQTRTDFASRSAQIERDTGKQLVVRTVPSLSGKDVSAAADAAFSSLNLNGVLIYAARDDKKLAIKVGTSTRQGVSTAEEGQIRDQLTAAFARNDFDGGLLAATDRLGNDLRAAFRPANTTGNTTNTGANSGAAQRPAPAPAQNRGGGIGALLPLLLVVGVIALVVVLVMRSRRPRADYSGGLPPQGNYPQGNYPEANYPQGGYGPGPQRGSGFGGSLAGGAIGGIGGAIVGNAVYDHFRDHNHDSGGNLNNAGGYVGGGTADTGDHGRVDDSYQDTGSWGGDSGTATGSWGGDSSDSGGGGGDSSSE